MVHKLTEREEEIVKLVAKGYKDAEIAKSLYLSRRRVGEIIAHIKNKWEVHSRVELGILAYHYHLIEPFQKENPEKSSH